MQKLHGCIEHTEEIKNIELQILAGLETHFLCCSKENENDPGNMYAYTLHALCWIYGKIKNLWLWYDGIGLDSLCRSSNSLLFLTQWILSKISLPLTVMQKSFPFVLEEVRDLRPIRVFRIFSLQANSLFREWRLLQTLLFDFQHF